MIGILGAGGSVGGAVAQYLASASPEQLLLCCRNPQGLPKEVAHCGRTRTLDVEDAAALGGVARACRVIVDCTAPSSLTAPLVVAACRGAGCDLVEAGWLDEDTLAWPQSGALVFGAGCAPGLAGVLPVYAAAGRAQCERVQSIYQIRDVFTPRAARDFIAGALAGGAKPVQAFLDAGSLFCRLCAFRPVTIGPLPLPVALMPYEDAETAHVRARLAPAVFEAYRAQEDSFLAAAMGRCRWLWNKDPKTCVRELCRASAQDVEDKGRAVRFLVRMECHSGPCAHVTTRLFEGSTQAGVTAGVLASAALLCLEGVKPGVWPLAASEHPRRLVKQVMRLGALYETSEGE